MGKRAFRKRYGQKRTMRACAKRHREQVASAVGTATQDWRTSTRSSTRRTTSNDGTDEDE